MFYTFYFYLLAVALSTLIKADQKVYETLNFLGIKPWLSVRQANTLTATPNRAYKCFLLFISTYYLCKLFYNCLTLILRTPERVQRLEKTLNFLGIEPRLSVRQADALTSAPNHA